MTDNERADLEALADYMQGNADAYHRSWIHTVSGYTDLGKSIAYANAAAWLRVRLDEMARGKRFSGTQVDY